MRHRTLLAVIILLAPIVTAVAAAQGGISGDALENVGQGSINWTSGEILATGIGAPPSGALNAAQARAMAVRAATVVAYRNLLEIVKGVRVDSESVIENFMVKSDVIRTRVTGVVRGARILSKKYLSDGSVEVVAALSMKGAFLDSIVPDSFGKQAFPAPTAQPAPVMPPAPPGDKRTGLPPDYPNRKPVPPVPEPRTAPEPPRPEPVRPPTESRMEPHGSPGAPSPEGGTMRFSGGKATGLVVDGRGLGLRPALLPKLVDPRGQEVYVGRIVPRTNAVEQGVAGYAKDVAAAEKNFRVTDNPAVIKGIRASGDARTDIVLSSADAKMLRDLEQKGDFLQYCRVIIVY